MNSDVVKSYNAVGAGIIAISFGAVFVRLAHAPAILVAALRMIFASLILLLFVLLSPAAKRGLARVSRKDILLLLLAGIFLALHFMLWISSLSLTGVTSSVVFVTTNPLFVALYPMLFPKEKVSRIFWLGLGFAILGGAIIGGNDVSGGGVRWKGDLLALAGAVAIAGYFLVGSRLRRRLSLIGYVFPVYSCAGLVLFIAALGEPVGASILALVILRETPGLTEILGGTSILFGIFLVLYFSSESSQAREQIASGG